MIDYKFKMDMSVYEQKMGRLGAEVIPYARTALKQFAEKGRDVVKAHTPATKTGTDIRGMWKLRHSRAGMVEQYIIENIYKNPDVIVFIEYGTRVHIIQPSRKAYLHFFWERVGRWVRSKNIRHPGMRGHFMITTAEAYLQPMIDQYVQQTYAMADKVVR